MTTLEYIEEAWKAYKRNYGSIIVALILQILITSIPIVIGLLPWIVIFLSSGFNLTSTGIKSFVYSNLGVLSFSLVMFIIGILTCVVLNGGFVRMLYEGLRKKTNFEVMLKTAKEKFWTILGANLFVGLVLLLIILISIAPMLLLLINVSNLQAYTFLFLIALIFTSILGIIVTVLVSILFVFVNQAIVVDNLNAFQSIKKSFYVSKKNFPSVLFLFLIFFVLNSGLSDVFSILGSIIAFFVTNPLLLICYTAFYVKRRKR